MQDLLTTALAAAGAKLASVLGGIATAYLIARVAMRTSDMLAVVPAVALPGLAIAVLLGWLLILVRPSSSIGAIALGLFCVAFTPLLSLQDGASLQTVLLSCASYVLLGLCFAAPAAIKTGLVATGSDAAVYGAAAFMLVPLTVWWVLDTVSIGPMQPSAELPSFKRLGVDLTTPEGRQAAAQRPSGLSFEASLNIAITEGRVPLNPKLQALRSSLLSAEATLRAAPCDAVARSRFRGAALNFLADQFGKSYRTGEVFAAAGERRQVTDELNIPAFTAVNHAFGAEIVSRVDVPAFNAFDSQLDVGLPKPDPASPLRCR